MRHFWNWVKNDDETRTLYLEGVIAEESWFADDVTPAMFKEELFSGDGPITLHINSPGGDCIAASQIYTMLMDYPHDVTVQIDGMAASAASVIAMAGTHVHMSPTSMMMIHNQLRGYRGMPGVRLSAEYLPGRCRSGDRSPDRGMGVHADDAVHLRLPDEEVHPDDAGYRGGYGGG